MAKATEIPWGASLRCKRSVGRLRVGRRDRSALPGCGCDGGAMPSIQPAHPTPPQPFAHPAPSVPHPCLTLSGQEASRQLTPKPGHAHSHTLGTHFLVVTQNYCCHTRLPGIAQLGVKIIKIKTPTEALKVAPRGMMDSRRRGRHKGLHPTPSTVASHGPRGHRDHQQCCPSLTQTQYFNLSAQGITSIHTLVRKNQAHALCGGHRP